MHVLFLFSTLLATICTVSTVDHRKSDLHLTKGNKDNAVADYYLSPTEFTFYEALEECAFLGGRLASILTLEEDDQINDTLKDASPNSALVAWTSGRYDYAQDNWAWEAINRPVAFTNWISSFPNPAPDTCIGIAAVRLPGDLYGWLPVTCGRESSLSFRAICQF